MRTVLPSVQRSARRAARIVTSGLPSEEKRTANRRHRRALARATRQLNRDPDRFDSELFEAPSLSGRDVA